MEFLDKVVRVSDTIVGTVSFELMSSQVSALARMVIEPNTRTNLWVSVLARTVTEPNKRTGFGVRTWEWLLGKKNGLIPLV